MNEAHNAGIKLERGKNAARNVVFGGAYRLYAMLAPFVMRTVLLYQLGVNFLGLDSLFASILQVLNLAELGVGSAMVFSMYKPIAEDDTNTICALMGWIPALVSAGMLICVLTIDTRKEYEEAVALRKGMN